MEPNRPLDGITVVEVADSVATAWCGRLLGQLGAAVTLAEPPSGSTLRTRPPLLPNGDSPWHHWLNGDKDSTVVTDDAGLADLAAGADVVVYPTDGSEDEGEVAALAAQLRRHTPHQVFAALSPFGLTGPWRSLASSELVEWAAGGHLYLTGDADREPVQGGGPWPGYFTGSTATIGILTALMDAGRTGHGQLVDIGAMEAMAAAHQWTITTYTHHGYVKRRDGNRLAESYHPVCVYPCRDAWVQVAAASYDQWEATCLATDCVELLADDRLQPAAGRYDHADEIDAVLGPWFAQRTAAEAIAALQEVRVPASVVNDVPGVLADPQLAARGYWSAVPAAGPGARVPGPAVVIGPRSPAPPTEAPALGEPATQQSSTEAATPTRADAAPAAGADGSSSGHGAPSAGRRRNSGGRADLPSIDLTGVRVLEFSIAWAGPLAGRYLADLGADVIKVEHPTSRGLSVIPGGTGSGWAWGELPPAALRNGTWPATDPGPRWFNSMGMFNKMQRNKRSLCLDVKAPGGEEVLHRLVAQSDVVLNNYSPRGVQSLGIDHDTLAQVNPDIITVSMSGYGATGPMASHFSFGPILETHAALASTTGYPDRGPLRVGVAFPDPAGGLLGAVATLSALWQRARTGSGVEVDMSQLETLLPVIGDHLLTTSATGRAPERLGNRSLMYAPQGVYRCDGDDEWLAVTVRSDEEWRRLVELVDRPVLTDLVAVTDAERWAAHDRIDEEITAWTTQRGKFDAMDALQGLDIPAMAVLTNADLVDGPQLQAREFIATFVSGDAGPQRLPGCPLHFSDRSMSFGPAPTPRPGQHRDRRRPARLHRRGPRRSRGRRHPGHRAPSDLMRRAVVGGAAADFDPADLLVAATAASARRRAAASRPG